MPNAQLDVASYRVGILCALSHERAAVEAALDEEHEWPKDYNEDDGNVYSFGKIGEHNVVIASLPEVRLLVGIGGGVPSKQHDIRLGDVVFSQPSGDHGGVIYALSALKARHGNPKRSKVGEHLAKITEELSERYGYQGAENDDLFPPDYAHVAGSEPCHNTNPFRRCDIKRHIKREVRSNPGSPRLHYGNIASGDEVIKNGLERDRIASGLGALCFEMEAAGLEDSFPCLVVRGICDYSDSHKNKDWQRYAAATAAAFAREFLSFVRVQTADDPTSKQRGQAHFGHVFNFGTS
ncbi:uncharacterized protein MYCFIDRAFT_191226 [Pseudocercospora fijiensis CIRAD86]|uniref:Nucleoside phosphorylase domain-containing protein n=1 Tax=Pseudocercospora fijiensis (strain CIRAD86) TaxID=383855 RepID=M3AL49_PSEFD|nr:uncharacterized protein MYCFIDRAFT_191226 [Pseudocercospora fijiensis CIRAD86]EME77878.1 hypothetical protein MYCFIDRAFT_191226 [Pseudocercospora fijiensis CIRAD86]